LKFSIIHSQFSIRFNTSMTIANPQSIWTRAFALLCIAQFLGYAHHFILQPTLPLYITQLGGGPFIVGIVIAAFGITSVIARPFIGAWVDRWHGGGVMVSGLLFLAGSVLFCFLPVVSATILTNGLRGIGWAGLNTGGYTMLAANAPAARRGEASGYYGAAQVSGTIFFPAVALWIIAAPFGGYQVAFAISLSLALIAAAIGAAIPRGVIHPAASVDSQDRTSWWREIVNVFDRNILLAAALLFCLQLSLPCLTSFVVLYAREKAVEHFAWFYVVSGGTSLLARPLLGRVSDRIGCGRSLVCAFILEIAGLLLLPMVSNLLGIMIAGVLYMMGMAIGGSRVLALAMEQAPAERRGRAMASFSMAFPLSNGAGAFLNGLVVDLAGYEWMYITAAALCSTGLVVTWRAWDKLK
jgi:MFS family permease